MLLGADPAASVGVALGATGLAAAGTVFAYFLYRPLFRMNNRPDFTAAQAIGRDLRRADKADAWPTPGP